MTSNTGSGPAAPSTTRFYLSPTPQLAPGMASLAARLVELLAAGAASAGSTALTVPPDTEPETYYLVASRMPTWPSRRRIAPTTSRRRP